MSERFDVAIVGAGPGASMAAYALAKAGLSVVMFERGDTPGAKAMFGGVLYTPILARFFPDFVASGCVERHVVEKRFALLSESNEITIGFRFLDFEPPYFNHSFTALRSRFDRWLATQAEAAGAMLVTSMVIDEVLRKDERIVGVRARREVGDVYANVVIAADGANSLLAQQAGLRKELPLSVILGERGRLAAARGDRGPLQPRRQRGGGHRVPRRRGGQGRDGGRLHLDEQRHALGWLWLPAACPEGPQATAARVAQSIQATPARTRTIRFPSGSSNWTCSTTSWRRSACFPSCGMSPTSAARCYRDFRYPSP